MNTAGRGKDFELKKYAGIQCHRMLGFLHAHDAVLQWLVSKWFWSSYQSCITLNADIKGEKSFVILDVNACAEQQTCSRYSVIWACLMCDKRICLILFARCLLSISLSFFPNDNGSLSNCQHFLSIDKTPEMGVVPAVSLKHYFMTSVRQKQW